MKGWASAFSQAKGVEGAQHLLSVLAIYAPNITKWVPLDKCQDPTEWPQKIGRFLSNLEPVASLEGADLFAAIVDPDLMESEISRSIRIDEAIDRKIKRLLQVKTAKQIFLNMRKNAGPEPKLINLPASADGRPPAIGKNQQRSAATVASIPKDAKKGRSAAETGIVVEGSRIEEDGSASMPLANKNGHSNELHSKVVVFAKPAPATAGELSVFPALCERLNQNGNDPKGVDRAN
jgi:hypothetical protein